MTERQKNRTLAERLQSGLRRRLRAVWRRVSRRGPLFPAEAALDWLLQSLDSAPDDLRAACVETLLDFGCREEVAGYHLSRDQVASLDATDVAAESIAHQYRAGQIEQADRAFRSLQRRQRADGSFALPANATPREQILTTKFYLDASLLRIAAAFDRHGLDLPYEIAVDDGRMIAVHQWFELFEAEATLADVGCGSGRFLVSLAQDFPGAKLIGIDPCRPLLNRLPSRIEPHEGTLLRTRLPDASLDGAFAVESLEHCLVPRRGIAEMCRIVRPGGRVLVIDKRRSLQALSEHEPWERWFDSEELTEWLAAFCDDIRVEPISHSEGLGGDDLFLAASGRKL